MDLLPEQAKALFEGFLPPAPPDMEWSIVQAHTLRVQPRGYVIGFEVGYPFNVFPVSSPISTYSVDATFTVTLLPKPEVIPKEVPVEKAAVQPDTSLLPLQRLKPRKALFNHNREEK